MTTISCIIGQTATGKTARAAQEAREARAIILSCDSQQYYKYVDIVTGARDTPQDIPVFGIGVADPKESHSSYDFLKYARAIIDKLARSGQDIILVGGSTMYSHHLIHGINHTTDPTSPELKHLSKNQLQVMLLEKDPKRYYALNESDRENPRRLVRQLARIQPLQDHAHTCIPPLHEHFNVMVTLLLHRSPEDARLRIESRVRERIRQGAIEEYRKLVRLGYKISDPGLKSAAYRHIADFVERKLSEDELVRRWVTSEYQYAKRQRTYFLKYFPEAHVVFV
jgi:tRNA dimethylallyltransferase